MQQITDIKRAIIMGTIEEIDIQSILATLKQSDDLYFNDEEPVLEDHEYDALKQYTQRVNPTDPYFTGVGSAVRGGKVPLPYKMGSLDQVYQGDFAKWVAQEQLAAEMAVISDKLDGASAMFVYGNVGSLQIAYSRGDGTMGADISRHARKIHNVPQTIPYAGPLTVRAENIISPANFKRINTGAYARAGRIYKNPRNMVSGLMNSSENHDEVYKVIDTVAYEIVGSTLGKIEQLELLAKLGFKVVRYTTDTCGKLNDDNLTELLNKQRNTTEYEIDGIVIDIDSASTRKRLDPNRDALNPAYSRKFKVADANNVADTEVTGIDWNISKDGYFKPRVQFKAIDLCGVTIQNATGFNAKYIRDNKIGPGAVVRITRSGDVIPFILAVVKQAEEAQMPDEDGVWTETGVDLIVADASNNDIVKFERLNDFFATLDIPNLGEGNLQKMFDCGFTTPESIIPLTQEDFGSLVNSLSIGKKIFTGMREKLTNVPLFKLMGAHAAFGRGVGVRKMKKLYEAFAGDMTKCADFNAIVAVEGFETKTANKIVNGVVPFNAFMAEIADHVTIAPYVAPKVGGLSGKVFVFTGFRSKELEQAIEAAGGKMGSSVSSKTSFLVTENPQGTSGKLQKARDVGVQVIGVDELKAML